MDLSFTPAEERFRAELRAWLAANPPGDEPDRLDDWVAYGKAWQRTLYEAGWCGVHWPKQYGGRGASLIEQIIFQEEMARARTPLLINLAGLTMGGPVLIAHGTDAQKRRRADFVVQTGLNRAHALRQLARIVRLLKLVNAAKGKH